MGSYAFTGCSALATVKWNAIDCASAPFRALSSITSFTLGNQVKTIPAEMCYNLNRLASIDLPASVTTIGSFAFYGCAALRSINIPAKVTSIGGNAFSGCSALTSARITDLAAWCRIAFKGGDSNPLTLAHSLYLNGTKVANLAIPEGVTEIADYAFSGGDITGATLPATIATIGAYAFRDCSGLQSIVIPESVTAVGRNAFTGCAGLTTVKWNARTCPDVTPPVQSYSPLSGLNGLTSIDFGHQVERIPRFLCYGLTGLTSAGIGRSVAEIGEQAFSGCTALALIKAYPDPSAVTLKAVNVFNGVSRATCRLHVLPVYTADYSTAPVWREFSCIIGDLNEVTGDLNGDNSVDSSDVSILLEMVLAGGVVPIAADINEDGALDSSDVAILLEMVLAGE